MICVTIKENSWLAIVAAKKLKVQSVAMVVGTTIHLYRCTRQEFIENDKWVKHEIAHVKQYQKLGIFQFLFFYILETFRNGYENNYYEVDARLGEEDPLMLDGVTFH